MEDHSFFGWIPVCTGMTNTAALNNSNIVPLLGFLCVLSVSVVKTVFLCLIRDIKCSGRICSEMTLRLTFALLSI
jgi:hypothetical protein